MSKTNKAASKITLASSCFDGMSGTFEVISRKPQSRLAKLFRRPRKHEKTLVYANVKGSKMRAWRRRR